MNETHGGPDARCPLRPGEPCTLCQLNVTGPQDCPLVYLVMSDPELREQLHQTRRILDHPAGRASVEPRM